MRNRLCRDVQGADTHLHVTGISGKGSGMLEWVANAAKKRWAKVRAQAK